MFKIIIFVSIFLIVNSNKIYEKIYSSEDVVIIKNEMNTKMSHEVVGFSSGIYEKSGKDIHKAAQGIADHMSNLYGGNWIAIVSMSKLGISGSIDYEPGFYIKFKYTNQNFVVMKTKNGTITLGQAGIKDYIKNATGAEASVIKNNAFNESEFKVIIAKVKEVINLNKNAEKLDDITKALVDYFEKEYTKDVFTVYVYVGDFAYNLGYETCINGEPCFHNNYIKISRLIFDKINFKFIRIGICTEK